MDNAQTIYKNKTLTHNLSQPAQEDYPLFTVTSLRTNLLSTSQNSKKTDDYLYQPVQEAKQKPL